jgi:flavin reductase (DIM6/NTAB) family NADH-FMN oxidoreductase RutF
MNSAGDHTAVLGRVRAVHVFDEGLSLDIASLRGGRVR